MLITPTISLTPPQDYKLKIVNIDQIVLLQENNYKIVDTCQIMSLHSKKSTYD